MRVKGRILAICTSSRKKTPKRAVDSAVLRNGYGIVGDAHAGNWHRQVSLLENEQIEYMRKKGLELSFGAFGENLVTDGFDLGSLEIGRRFRVGSEGVLQVTQIGKECHDRCVIYEQVGDCIMPTHGVFARVRRGGSITPDDTICTDADLDLARYAVVVLSDKGAVGEREDTSGGVIREIFDRALHARQVTRVLLPDSRELIENELVRLCDQEICDLIVTTGGTGLSPRDVTPEATAAVVDRQIPGMAEAIRSAGLAFTSRAMLSRGICGQRGSTLIVNLSGSPKAVREQLEVLLPVLPHAIQTASGIPQDCAR